MKTWCLRYQEDNENPAFSIVIPTRNRFGPRVRNCIRGVQLQTQERIELIIADYGSSKEGLERLLKTLDYFNCTIYHYETDDVWSLSGARNLGIRRSNAKYVATLDVDCIMEPEVVATSVGIYKEHPDYFIVNRVCHCPEDLDVGSLRLPRDYPKLHQKCKCVRPGIGAYMSAPRKWWFKVRGFDERIKRWGADDDDMKKRAQADGRRAFISNKTRPRGVKIYHQWHPKSEARLNSSEQQAENYRILKKDDTIIRNGKDWGYV